MYMSEISIFKISDLKPQKMTILWTLKHVSAISKHPVHRRGEGPPPWDSSSPLGSIDTY